MGTPAKRADDGILILPLIKLKNVVKVEPPLTKLSGSAHAEERERERGYLNTDRGDEIERG